MKRQDFKNGDIVKMSDWHKSIMKIDDNNKYIVNGYDLSRNEGDTNISRLATIEDVYEALVKERTLKNELVLKLKNIERLSQMNGIQQQSHWDDAVISLDVNN